VNRAVGKLIAALTLVIAVVAIRPQGSWFGLSVEPWLMLAGAWVLIALGSRRGAFPLNKLLLRTAGMAPFIALLALPILLSRGWSAGWEPAALTAGKSLTALATMTLLAGCTPFEELLAALTRLRVPALFTTTLAFLHRYLHVLSDELHRMRRAKLARSARSGRLADWSLHSRFIALLFVRAFERAERIYSAMCARGWDGR